MMNSVSKTGTLFFLLMGLGTLCTAMVPHSRELDDTVKPRVSYLGRIEGQPVLQVEFDNQEGKPYTISIKDQEGRLLYSSDFSSKKFIKKFQVVQDEPGDMQLTLTFSSGRIKETQVTMQ